ncbi:Hypothetical protein domain [Nesidiocoris tenuis]|uniref:PDZ domain-containing protein n=2 Tax=Nesidiocoris tenuis TaxID=355587 RepID=A0ABN7AVU7_9HEMI|nr:Hypothetical protein domain [Nesidiocoris tenuis]
MSYSFQVRETAHSLKIDFPSHELTFNDLFKNRENADLRVAEPTTYESEDETMGRRKQTGRLKRGTPTYSKQDIREQYCINDRQLLGLEDTTSGLFGCLSSYQDSSCSSRSPSLLTVCVRRRIPSDENLAELVRRPMAEYAPFPRWMPPYPPPLHAYPSPAGRPMKAYYHDHYPPFYPDDDEPCRMHICNQERPRPLRDFDGYPPRRFLSYSSEYLIGRHEPCPAHPHILPPPPPPPSIQSTISHRPKHVSFARSHTMQSFDDTVSFGSGSCITSCSQERLIDGKKSSESPKVVVMEKPKRAPMKTQATQTEVCLGRKPLPPNYLSLSPRTVQRVRMVSQGAQTNGDKTAARKLMKSFSEVGKFGNVPVPQPPQPQPEIHEPLQRTQSEEPRSPFVPPSPKEIFINFEPLEKKQRKKLSKTLSDGEILECKGGKDEGEPCTLSDGELASAKSTHEADEDDVMGPTIGHHLLEAPARKLISADSQEEEFHENLIYQNIFRHARSDSLESPVNGVDSNGLIVASSPSPFASCDSLNTKDHSDGIWNESQMTVLQADSDNNGTATGVSCSDLSSSLIPGPTSAGGLSAMTPSSRRKHQLLLQHQQRSSMDTDVLDQEDIVPEHVPAPQLPPKPKPEQAHVIPTVAVTTPTHEKPPDIKLKPLPPPRERRTDRPKSPQKLRRRSPGARTPESEPHHSSSATLSSNEAFARSDSGRTNTTDMSEASTTDDYATATENNSEGSGRQPKNSDGIQEGANQPGTANGSFESGSSLYSLTRADATEEQQVPCSPPLVEDDDENKISESAEDKADDGDGDTSSAESSSCGSYSVEGSSDKLGHSDKSGQCSSTGGYDSPFEDRKQRKWTTEEKSKAKKGFKLELSASVEQPETPSTATSGKTNWQKKPTPGTSDADKEKTPVNKSPATKRSSVQITKDVLMSPGKSPSIQEPKRDEWPHRHLPEEKKSKISNGIGPHDSTDETSDECTCGKGKRRETLRRKTPATRSPTAHPRERRRSVSGEEIKRRSSMIPTKSPSPVTMADELLPSRLSPRSALSPGGSPSRTPHGYKGIVSPDTTRLKALSAESLRSVSPGSDSVFYSEPSSNTVTDKCQQQQPACQHCGRQYESQAKTAAEKPVADIVQPPAGFEDSPRTPHRTRLYKKADKRYRSEERRHRMHADAARAKSEERAREERKDKVRPLTRSTDASMEKLNTQSSFDDDDEWQGVISDAYRISSWVYIGGTEELKVWQRPDSREGEVDETQKERRDSLESTQSETEFRRKYQSITHRMVHRKSSLEMYKRLASKCFESDKRVLVKRVSGEFGFRIHGSRPVVVSCIEAGTPAESSGLEVGDIIISVNNTNVLDSTHSDVVKLAHGGSDVLELEVARTFDRMGRGTPSPPMIAGCLFRHSNSSKAKCSWILRYFVLKQDHYLYHYKSEAGGQPLGAINLSEYTVVQVADPERPHGFKISKKGSHSLYLAALSAGELDQWLTAFSEACKPQMHVWESSKCLAAPPTKIVRPDCAGTLSTLVHHRGKTWKRRFCILKDACLYFYTDINAENALGLICLHGYRVQSSTSASRKFSFELVPPESSFLHLYFYTDTELDKKRWLAALEYAIDRWVKVG